MKAKSVLNMIFILIVSFLAVSCLRAEFLLGKHPDSSFPMDYQRSFGQYIAYDSRYPLFQPVPVDISSRTGIVVYTNSHTHTRRVAEVGYDFSSVDASGEARYKVIFKVRIRTTYSETTWIDVMNGQGNHYERIATYSLRGNQDESQDALKENEDRHGVIRLPTASNLIRDDGDAQFIEYRLEGGVLTPGQLHSEHGLHARLLRIQTSSVGVICVYIHPEVVEIARPDGSL